MKKTVCAVIVAEIFLLVFISTLNPVFTNVSGSSRHHAQYQELAEAMLVILKNAYGALPDSLYHETARIFGYDRMTQKIRQKCEEALFSLLMTERVRLVEGKIRLLG